MEIINFDRYPCWRIENSGGSTCEKARCIFNGESWLLKIDNDPMKNRNHAENVSVLREYLGSQIYASMGIPVHETMIGIFRGRVAVGCKDFTAGSELIKFSQIRESACRESEQADVDIKNKPGSISENRIIGERLNDVLAVIRNAPVFDGLHHAVEDRFWDMFITDAFILNSDRNDDNWGLLLRDGAYFLAPVYDNGNAFINAGNAERLQTWGENDSIRTADLSEQRSFFLDDAYCPIHPYDFVHKSSIEKCRNARIRFSHNLNWKHIIALIEEVPEQAENIPIVSAVTKNYCKKLLLKSAQLLRIPDFEMEK